MDVQSLVNSTPSSYEHDQEEQVFAYDVKGVTYVSPSLELALLRGTNVRLLQEERISHGSKTTHTDDFQGRKHQVQNQKDYHQ
jgi:hypothetical protein